MKDNNQQLFERALKVMPGGVNSPVRSFQGVGGTPYFVEEGKGAYVWDEEANCYLDYVQSYGATILGHTPKVLEKEIKKMADKGLTFGAPTKAEVLLAEEICHDVGGLEMVRMVSSGTEAAMASIRLARGVTGRKQIIKFAGCYHGHSDALLAAGGSGVASQGIIGSPGVTDGAIADTIVVPYNEVPEITEEVAAVIVEPIAANMGVVAPEVGFLGSLRTACDAAGALLIFDEVITGFRVAKGGSVQIFGVIPDLWCFGKIIGGGLPLGAFGGKESFMQHLAPLGSVYQAGTLSGNPLATTAGLITLQNLHQASYDELKAKAEYLSVGLRHAAEQANLPIQISQMESLMSIFFTEDFSDPAPTNFDEVQQIANNGIYPLFFHKMLARGFAFAPSPYETIFLSLAHNQQDLDETIEAAGAVFKNIAAS